MRSRVVLTGTLLLCMGGQALAQLADADSSVLSRQWPGPDGEPLPFKTLQEVMDFLRTAKVIESQRTEEGITGARKILLEKNGIQMHAVFRDVRVRQDVARFSSGSVKIDFRDEAIFECAAYELGRLLGVKFVPPTVRRTIKRTAGTVQAWVEDATMQKELRQEKIEAPDQWLWLMQHQVMYIFDSLVFNEDRNLGNILYMPDWKMILIDHTRSFRPLEELLNPSTIRFCERDLYRRLQELDRKVLDDRVGPFLTSTQIEAVLKRRDLLLEHIQQLIAEHGEDQVLFSFYRVEN